MPSPLNPVLYNRLREEFGRVQIAHAGVAAVVSHSRGLLDNKLRVNFASAGEYYRVPCPYCGDRRSRLWINHLWGVPDEVTGKKNLWAAICYNESCLSMVGRAGELYDRIYGFQNANLRGRQIQILPGEVEETALRPVNPPGDLIRVDRMPDTDQVPGYLRSRGLDVNELGQIYGVSYCLNANENYPMAQGRIIVPIFMDQVLVGWQGRYVGELNWKEARIPKYYSLPNMPRRLMLYNYDRAAKSPFVVVCEGPADAWNIGPYAVASFGKHLSHQQVGLVCSTWGDGAIIVMLDGEAWEDTQQLARRFQDSIGSGVRCGAVIPVRLPPDRDPGSLDRDLISDYIIAAADVAGVDLLSMKRKTDANRTESSEVGSFDSGREPTALRAIQKYSFDSPRHATAGT